MSRLLNALGGREHLEKTIGAKNFADTGRVVTFRFKESKLANTLELVEIPGGRILALFWIVPSREGRQIVKVHEQETTLEDLKGLFEKTTGVKL
jgi:hypothetical protein